MPYMAHFASRSSSFTTMTAFGQGGVWSFGDHAAIVVIHSRDKCLFPHIPATLWLKLNVIFP